MCVPIAQSSFRYFPQPLPLLPLFHYYSRRGNPWRLPSNIICAMFGSVGSLQNQRLSESNQTNSFAIDSHTHTPHTYTHTARVCYKSAANNIRLLFIRFIHFPRQVVTRLPVCACVCVSTCLYWCGTHYACFYGRTSHGRPPSHSVSLSQFL